MGDGEVLVPLDGSPLAASKSGSSSPGHVQ
jgi:hypothetical protein